MSKNIKIEVDLDKLLKFKVPVEGFFVMYLMFLNKQEVLGEYLAKSGTISLKMIEYLSGMGYLTIPKYGEVNTRTVKITDKFKIDFIDDVVGVEFEQLLKELRETYPKKIKTETGGTRYLQPDPRLIKELYKKNLVKKGVLDLELHKSVLKAIKFEIWQRTKDNTLHFMQQLTRYIRHQNWLVYLEDAKQWKEETINTDNGAEVI